MEALGRLKLQGPPTMKLRSQPSVSICDEDLARSYQHSVGRPSSEDCERAARDPPFRVLVPRYRPHCLCNKNPSRIEQSEENECQDRKSSILKLFHPTQLHAFYQTRALSKERKVVGTYCLNVLKSLLSGTAKTMRMETASFTQASYSKPSRRPRAWRNSKP